MKLNNNMYIENFIIISDYLSQNFESFLELYYFAIKV